MSNQTNFPDDPSATYRGYRRQALYCLYRLFDDGLPNNSVIQPEGNEDLAIYSDSNVLIEVVQVKDHTADLTASVFKPSFYRRISALCRDESSVRIKIVSFGPIGPELAKAYDNSQAIPTRALNTLTKEREELDSRGNKVSVPGLTEEEAKGVFSRGELEEVEESNLTRYVIDRLAAMMTSGDPTIAFENLMWWLISSAEKQRKLTRLLSIEKLAQMGRFLTHRAAHEHEWNVSIKPIQCPSINGERKEKLKAEFFQGGRVLPEHIAAGLDVPRMDALNRIHEAFQQQNVVILRAASGQGKTTLAYRYLLDWTPTNFRFQIGQAANLQHARRMAAAISGHTEVIDVPTIVYIDVRPGDSLWVEFVRELTGATGVRVLVTIREEDWFRSRVSQDDFAFLDLPLPFTEESAAPIFRELRANGYGVAQFDFADAWSQLGHRKTLFEFVYLATQNQQLTERIRGQINNLKDQVNRGELAPEELRLLRLVAVASAYEARLQLKELANSVNIPEPSRTVERFSNEYLLRMSDDGRHVEGFHAIRSEIIAAELTDSVLTPRGDIESVLPRLLVEDDLESFLLCSFSRNRASADKVVNELLTMRLRTWIGVRHVLAALLWLGLKNYAEDNEQVLHDVRSDSPTNWWLTLDWDLAQARGKEGFRWFESLATTSVEFAQAAIVADECRRRQTDKDGAFSYGRQWLGSFGLPTNTSRSVSEFIAIGEVLFWLGHLQQSNANVDNWLNAMVIYAAWEILPLHLFALFASGVRRTRSDVYNSWVSDNRKAVESKLRERSAIIALVEDQDCLVAHFAIDLDRNSSQLRPAQGDASINDLSVQRVEVIAACLPGFAQYGASGYGHKMSLFDGSVDDSTKRMPVENIRIPWLPEFNALARGVVEYAFRPDSWKDYFSRVRLMRGKVISALGDLHKAADVARTNGNGLLQNAEAWSECQRLVNGGFYLPKCAVDEWGFVTESRAEHTSEKTKRFGAITTLDPFNKALNKYTSSVGNFMRQSFEALLLVQALNSATTETGRRAVIKKGTELGIDENAVRLSVVNGMNACIAVRLLHRVERSLFQDKTVGIDEQYHSNEFEAFLSTIVSWALLCFPEQILPRLHKPNKKWSASKRRVKDHLHKPELRDSLLATTNRIDDALTRLKEVGITAKRLDKDIQWSEDSALCITFDTPHPVGTLVAIEKVWFALTEAFRPDRDKIVRIMAIDWFWERIVVVPLTQGRSIERQAYANMKGVSYPLDENPESQPWQFVPVEVPEMTFKQLGIIAWDRQPTWNTIDRFATAYAVLFHHVDHMADFTRCKVDLDEIGNEIVQKYLQIEAKRAEPFLQDVFDSCTDLLKQFPTQSDSEITARPNIREFMGVLLAMDEAIQPSDDFDKTQALTLDAIADWRNRLKVGLGQLAVARALWIADSLGFDAFIPELL